MKVVAGWVPMCSSSEVKRSRRSLSVMAMFSVSVLPVPVQGWGDSEEHEGHSSRPATNLLRASDSGHHLGVVSSCQPPSDSGSRKNLSVAYEAKASVMSSAPSTLGDRTADSSSGR